MIKRIRIGTVFLGSTVLLGDALLNLEFTGNLLDDITGIALAVILAVFTALLLKSLYKKSLGKAIFLPLLIWSAFFALYSFSQFAAPVMLKSENIVIPFLIMLGVAFYLGCADKKVIFKISIIALSLVALLIIIIAAFSLQFVSLKYLWPHKNPAFAPLKTFLPLYSSLISAFLPVIVLIEKSREMVFSTALFSALFSLCTINVLGIFGSEFAATLRYPYDIAVSSAATGEIFSRLDGFFYIICFFCALIKIGAAINAFNQTRKALNLKVKA